MCKLFIDANPDLWAGITRSIRIDGVVSSIRLELFFWQTLEEIAFRDKVSLAQMVTRLYRESLDANHDASNFTSFLRVCASRYLSLAADGLIQRQSLMSLYDLDARELLKKEADNQTQRAQQSGNA